jgi:hypothetical protein
MATVNFAPNLQRPLILAPREISGNSLLDILRAAFAEQGKLKGSLLHDQGRVLPVS